MKKLNSIGVVIGRFQVDELHAGHCALIDYVLERHPMVLVLVGSGVAPASQRNPLSYEARKAMLRNAYSTDNIYIRPLADQATDEGWSQQVDSLLRLIGMDITDSDQAVNFILYGGRDSFRAHYTGAFPTEEFPQPTEHVDLSGTALRERIGKTCGVSPEFRRGVIHSTQNRYPISYQAVDIAVLDTPNLRDVKNGWSILLGRKPGETSWRLPGGFVDPTDGSLEDAARREAMEETHLPLGSLTYLDSFRVDDWRYRGETDKIMTALFLTGQEAGEEMAGDDLEEIQWFSSLDLLRHVNRTHLELIWRVISATVNLSKGLQP